MAYVSISSDELNRLQDDPPSLTLLLKLRLWSWHNDTDGRIPPPTVRGAAAEMDVSPPKAKQLVARLEREQIVSQLDGGGCLQDHGYAACHQTTEQRTAVREKYARYNAKRPTRDHRGSDGGSDTDDDGGYHRGNHPLSGAERSEAELKRSVTSRGTLHDATSIAGKGSPTTPPSPVFMREDNGNLEDLKPEIAKVLADTEAAGESIPAKYAARWEAWKQAHLGGGEKAS